MESGDESMNDEPEVRKQPVVRRSGHKKKFFKYLL